MRYGRPTFGLLVVMVLNCTHRTKSILPFSKPAYAPPGVKITQMMRILHRVFLLVGHFPIYYMGKRQMERGESKSLYQKDILEESILRCVGVKCLLRGNEVSYVVN